MLSPVPYSLSLRVNLQFDCPEQRSLSKDEAIYHFQDCRTFRFAQWCAMTSRFKHKKMPPIR